MPRLKQRNAGAVTAMYTVRCYTPTADGYVLIEALNATQRRELSDMIVGKMGTAMQELVNRNPAKYGKVIAR